MKLLIRKDRTAGDWQVMCGHYGHMPIVWRHLPSLSDALKVAEDHRRNRHLDLFVERSRQATEDAQLDALIEKLRSTAGRRDWS